MNTVDPQASIPAEPFTLTGSPEGFSIFYRTPVIELGEDGDLVGTRWAPVRPLVEARRQRRLNGDVPVRYLREEQHASDVELLA